MIVKNAKEWSVRRTL